jgi:arylsulfatase A-like enzyme
MKQPNFLFIMADQMAAPALPFYGHPVVQTPHLSRLVENGVVFDNAYCNSPLCAPSRFSMLTGHSKSTTSEGRVRGVAPRSPHAMGFPTTSGSLTEIHA